MRHQILHAPAFSALRLDMDEGESIVAQPGSMQAMTPGFHVEVRLGLQQGEKRGVFGGMRSVFGGESFFSAIYKAKRGEQHIMLAPDQMGEIRPVQITADTGLMLAPGAFLAASPDLGFKLHYAGVKGLLATRGLFFLKTDGEGMLFLSSYGGVIEQTLAAGERFVLDNRNIVAFSQTMDFESVVLTKSLKDSFLSGEGFIVRFTGPGNLIYQTRARPSVGMIRGLFQVFT
jgi:uncharacterized protein (TIGR00266 family)